MEWYSILVIILGLIFILFLSGIPVAFAFILLNFIGLYVWLGGTPAWHLIILSAYDVLTMYEMLAVLFFILMGEVLYHTGVVKVIFESVDTLIGEIRGRLSYITVIVSTIMAAVSGSVLGVGAALGSTLGPEMKKSGYRIPVSFGPIMGGACLAMLIPPSAFAVLVATLGHLPVGKMLMGGVGPGLMLAAMYIVYLFIRIYRNPSLVPRQVRSSISRSEKVKAALRILPLAILFFLVTGTIVLGIATPTEASAFGALGAFLVAWIYRRTSWKGLHKAIVASGEIIGMIFLIVMGSKCFSQLLGATGATEGMLNAVMALKLSVWSLIFIMQVVVLFMGMIMDEISIMMITLPIYMPILRNVGFDPLLFGILFLMNLAIALLTPPFGLLIFVIKGVSPPDIKLLDLYKAALPWVAMMVTGLVLVAIFPKIALWLPSAMH